VQLLIAILKDNQAKVNKLLQVHKV